ncbi:thiamine phosphate synthase [Leucobacter sp. GX24907]
MNLGLYFVTDAGLCGERGVTETVRRAVDGGATIVQLRDKLADGAAQLRQLEELADAVDGRARLVINDRLDVAVAARERGLALDGIHLGQGDAAALEARAVLGPDAIVGLTANTAEHLDAVHRLPSGTVDYLGIGVIRPTSTKPDHPPALGVEGFARLAGGTPLPCVAIGGLRTSDIAALRRGGAAGIAVVSALCSAEDPAASARALRLEWEQAS